jgi:hypothetical protein
MLSKCHYTEHSNAGYCYAEFFRLIIIMLGFADLRLVRLNILNFDMVSVAMISVLMQSIVK